ncbi:MAG: PH domain-containing protein [Candidatus Eisenbacteria bacterium]|uniref:PH domain-containing protein n=1 Tax=Eiseniibacteriota bacterium TaxID=2212470 RepID=A0A948W5S4_UNCEI|nr:PH domain-containing protein [Candidatus Eisenbacteria bacterium]MBU1949594.1 PH domain-containing protein [Candidatus Eisenbacteria bacterium]MBU2690744.1 PH domain-containing protein [Candidatus Eisenbacteria bacterium]
MEAGNRSDTPLKPGAKSLPYISQRRIRSFRRGALGLSAGLLALNAAVVWHLMTAESSNIGTAFQQIFPGLAGSIFLILVLIWLARHLGYPQLEVNDAGLTLRDPSGLHQLAWKDLQWIRLNGNRLILEGPRVRLSLAPYLLELKNLTGPEGTASPHAAFQSLLETLLERAPQASWRPDQLKEWIRGL